MRELGNRRAARTISLALVAGLVAFETVLAVTAGAVGIPGVLLVRLAELGGGGSSGGGESVIAKQPTQAVEPVASAALEQAEGGALPAQPAFPAIAFLDSAAAEAPAAPLAPPVVVDEPVIAADAAAPEATNATKDLNLASISTPDPSLDEPASDKKPPRQTLRNSIPTEDLPWDDTVPVPLSQLVPQASAESAPASPPQTGDMQAWVKSKAAALAGGVDDRGRPLYRFELWVEPPAEVKQRLVSVAYDVGSASAQPRTQESSEHETGFRVRYGSLACADKITLTLKFNDGKSQQVAVDGCKLQG